MMLLQSGPFDHPGELKCVYGSPVGQGGPEHATYLRVISDPLASTSQGQGLQS